MTRFCSDKNLRWFAGHILNVTERSKVRAMLLQLIVE